MLEQAFRSIIDIRVNSTNDPTIPIDNLAKNLKSFKEADLIVEEKPYKKLKEFIFKHYDDHGDIPEYNYLHEYFSEGDGGDETVIVALNNISSQKPAVAGTYRAKLKDIHEKQNIERFQAVVQTSYEICSSGKTFTKGQKKENLKGLENAVNYFSTNVRSMLAKLRNEKSESQIICKEETAEELELYRNSKIDPSEKIGILTGLGAIDAIQKGLKRKEFMICAAHTGQFKSTFSLNMAYQAVESGKNTAFITLEMPHTTVRRIFYLLHSCNPKFLDTKYRDVVGKLSYENVEYGNLSPIEEEYYCYVLNDLENCPDYGRLYVWQPVNKSGAGTTVSEVDLKLREINSEFKNIDRDLEFAVVDYISLLMVDKEFRQKDNNENLNFIIKTLKQICLQFNNGQGLSMLSPFQTNRAGYAEAIKNGGIYNTTALSNAHEAERSADFVISIFADEELRRSNQLKICCLKNRMGDFFQPFNAMINFNCRYIFDKIDDLSSIIPENTEGVIDIPL
jgi:hypothetical protein